MLTKWQRQLPNIFKASAAVMDEGFFPTSNFHAIRTSFNNFRGFVMGQSGNFSMLHKFRK